MCTVADASRTWRCPNGRTSQRSGHTPCCSAVINRNRPAGTGQAVFGWSRLSPPREPTTTPRGKAFLQAPGPTWWRQPAPSASLLGDADDRAAGDALTRGKGGGGRGQWPNGADPDLQPFVPDS